MRSLFHKPPQRIKTALVASFFVAAQLSLGLSGGKVLAAEASDHANEHATESLVEHQPANTPDPNENANTEHGPTNPVAVAAIQQATDNQQKPEPESNPNKPAVTPPAVAVEHVSEHANDHAVQTVTNTREENTPATPQVEEVVMVTLCHATGSTSNPFVKITIAAEGAYNGHLGSDHQNGEDIIPPFTFNGHSYSQNWDSTGQATFRNNCVASTSGGQPEEVNVTLCHATGSATNPFVTITVSAAGAFNGHLGMSHQNGEDIIPPFTFNGNSYSQNWDAAGQATFHNGCVVPAGGQGGNGGNEENGEVLGASTVSTPAGGQGAGEQLVNTGSYILMDIIISLTILGMTAGAHLLTRRQYM